jgi:hypothetical protein
MRGVVVTLDGKPVRWVDSFDTERGYVTVVKRDAAGKLIKSANGERVETETLRGVVHASARLE